MGTVAVIRVLVPTSGSTIDITSAGFGTPVCFDCLITQAGTDDTIASGGAFGIGFSDGTTHKALGIHNDDVAATTNTDRWGDGNAVVVIPDTSTIQCKLSFNSWITDGVRLTINTNPGTPLLLTVRLWGSGAVEQAKVFERGLGSTTAPLDFTGVGFELDAMFLAHNYSSSLSGLVHSPFGIGCVINDTAATPTQKSVAWCGDNGSTAGDQNTISSDSYALVAPLLDLNRWNLTISDIDATGFTHTNSASTGTIMIGLALKFVAGAQVALQSKSIPSVGDLTVTGLPFQPEHAQLAHVVGPTAYDTLNTGSGSGVMSVAMLDDAQVITNSTSDQDGAPDTVCKSLSSDQFRVLSNDGINDAALASAHALTSDGIDLTMSTNPASDVPGWFFAFAASAAAGPSLLLGAAGV